MTCNQLIGYINTSEKYNIFNCQYFFSPQTKFFVLMINDLDVNTSPLWKFVDDTTASDVVPKGNTSKAQSIVNQVIEWSHINREQLNPDKRKELQISFSRNPVELDAVVIDRKELEVVSTVKLLGLTTNANLTWNAHVENVAWKAIKRFYFLVQLKRTKFSPTDLILYYNTCIGPWSIMPFRYFITPCRNIPSTRLFVLREGRSQSFYPARATIMNAKSLA